jgi:hypothetical protein
LRHGRVSLKDLKKNMLKKAASIAWLVTTLPISANAEDLFDDPGVLLGMSVNLDGSPSSEDVGLTAKVLSNTHEDSFVVGAGLSFFPWAPSGKNIGADISAGYNFENFTVMGGWDFLRSGLQMSGGWSNIENESTDGPAGGGGGGGGVGGGGGGGGVLD